MTYLLLFLTLYFLAFLTSGYLDPVAEAPLEGPTEVSAELPTEANVTQLVYDWAYNTRRILLGAGYIPTGPCNREICTYHSCANLPLSRAIIVVRPPWASVLTEAESGEVRWWFSGFHRELSLVSRGGRLDFDVVYRQRCYGDLPVFFYPGDQDPEIDCSEILRLLGSPAPVEVEERASIPWNALSSPYSDSREYLPLRRAKTPWDYLRSRIHGPSGPSDLGTEE